MKSNILFSLFWILLSQFQYYSAYAADKINFSKKELIALGPICKEPSPVQKGELDNDMRKYLDDNKEAYDTTLYCDINGDKLIDKVFLVKCSSGTDAKITEKLIVILRQKQKKYRAYMLEDFQWFRDYVYIRRVGPGKMKEFETGRVIKIDNIGIERVYEGKSSGVYYWNGSKFLYGQISD